MKLKMSEDAGSSGGTRSVTSGSKQIEKYRAPDEQMTTEMIMPIGEGLLDKQLLYPGLSGSKSWLLGIPQGSSMDWHVSNSQSTNRICSDDKKMHQEETLHMLLYMCLCSLARLNGPRP